MRLLHTSDWHLGRTFAQECLLEDQAHLLEQVYAAIVDHDVQALIIAGDIFDRAVPKKEAVALFSDFLARVYSDTTAAIVAIAGNHDAPERVSFNNALQDTKRVLIRGPLRDRPKPLLLEDEHGAVALSALPYSEVFAARDAFGSSEISCPEQVLAAQVREAKAHVPDGARWVVTAHAFVTGGRVTETERPLAQVGGIETVSSGVFAGASYVALGHLHRAQTAGEPHVRYCGSLMGFGFDEAGESKTLSLVHLDGTGMAGVEELSLDQRRPLRVVTGKLAELIEAARSCDPRDAACLIKAVLTDEGALVDAIGQLRAVYPHVLQLERRRAGERVVERMIAPDGVRSDPAAVVTSFLEVVRGEPPAEAEAETIRSTLAEVALEEA